MIQTENKFLFSQRPIPIGRKVTKGAKDQSKNEKTTLILHLSFCRDSANLKPIGLRLENKIFWYVED